MWVFVFPRPDGSVFSVALGGIDLTDAFHGFARYHWNEAMPAVGVWRNSACVGRVLPHLNLETLRMEPRLIEH